MLRLLPRHPARISLPGAFVSVTALFLVAGFATSTILVARSAARPGPEDAVAHPDSATRDIVAVRVNPHAPAIDGRLDDGCWEKARPVRGFVQREPDEGQPSRQITEARVLYDDAALYAGVMAFDTEPDKIRTQLTRRDTDTESDQILLIVDTFHDHRTGYQFAVNASGVKRDLYEFNDGEDDAEQAGTPVALHEATEEHVPCSEQKGPRKGSRRNDADTDQRPLESGCSFHPGTFMSAAVRAVSSFFNWRDSRGA